jgi:competence protein ComGC
VTDFRGHIKAFTVLEILMVLAISGILITVLFNALNRFQQQSKVITELQDEMNNWYQFRSQMWSDFYSMDSLKINQQELTLYIDSTSINYSSQGDEFKRFEPNKSSSVAIELAEMKLTEAEGIRQLVLLFNWKGEIMQVTYPVNTDRKRKIDEYFSNL